MKTVFFVLACISPVSPLLTMEDLTGDALTTAKMYTAIEDNITRIDLAGRKLNSQYEIFGTLSAEELANLEIEIEKQNRNSILCRSELRESEIRKYDHMRAFLITIQQDTKRQRGVIDKYRSIQHQRKRLLEEYKKQVLVDLGMPDDVYDQMLQEYLT